MKNKTISDFLNYLVSDLFVKGFLFISLPLLSRVMSPEEYGKLSLINAAIMIMFVFLSLNIQNAVSNRYMRNNADFGSYLFSNIAVIIPIQVVIISISPFYLPYLSGLFNLSERDVFFVLLICSLLSIFYTYTSYLQASRQSKDFSLINIITKVGEVILLFLFAIYLSNNQYLSKIYAQSIIVLLSLLYVAPKFYQLLTFNFKFSYVKEALYFSIPLLPHVLANSLLAQVDRLIIDDQLGTAATGIYSFSYNLSMAIVVIVMAWNSSWQPRLYKLIENGDKDKISKVSKSSTLILLVLSIFTILYTQEIVVIFSSADYYESIKIIPIIIIGNALIHIYLTYANFVFYEKKTMFISLATLLALIVNVIFNVLFIPVYGIEGAAWATVIAYACMCLSHYLLSTYVLKLNFLSIKLFFFYIVGLLFSYIIFVKLEQIMSYWMMLAFKVLLTIFVLILIWNKKSNLEFG
ncbi:oligosaccharide flippase family protein [Vibrio sp. 10N.261.49.A12]|uniref:oligosaccharide flippase family protein n=1 Tax=Vibrio sp. 10N.261.49.A12 TaxID=3229667 RepID=UPI0035537E0B